MLKMTLSLLVLAMCCVLLAACAGGGGDPVAKTRAVAFANAVNLRGSDVPGKGILVRAFEGMGRPPFENCAPQVGASDEVVAVDSPWMNRSRGQRLLRGGLVIVGRPPSEGLHSVVYVMREPGIASRNVAWGRTAGAPECVTRLSVLENSGFLIHGEAHKLGISASAIPFPLADVAGYGIRVQGTLAAAIYHLKKRPAYYEDTFGFAVGPAEIVLHADGIPRPFPSAEERRLLSLLYERAKTHALS